MSPFSKREGVSDMKRESNFNFSERTDKYKHKINVKIQENASQLSSGVVFLQYLIHLCL